MTDKTDDLMAWLEKDELRSRPYRAERLDELLSIFDSPRENVLFRGGTISHQSYTELRLAFIHGLYLSTVLLALACIEQELAGEQYAQGMDDAARTNLENLLHEAKRSGDIDDELFDEINQLRVVRNSYAHYRPPTHLKSYIQRSVRQVDQSIDLSKADALKALHVLAKFINRSSF